MDYDQLVKDQELVDKYIRRIGLNWDVDPICDGVVDPKIYAETKPRIAWVLKEPYDDFDEQGNPCGGGWSMSDIYHATKNVYDNIKGNRTLYSMAYTTYGILNNTEYRNMPWIYQDPNVANSLRSVVHMNISKIPGRTTTYMRNISSYYNLWRPILLFQLKVYNPQIVIFGNVMPFFYKDLGLEEIIQSDCEKMVKYAVKDDCLYIDAWHPGRRADREKYVDGIVNLVRGHAQDINLEF